MKFFYQTITIIFFTAVLFSCDTNKKTVTELPKSLSAKDILGNPKYLAISYGGYRDTTRDNEPTIEEIKEDVKILFAVGIRVLRTYNVQLKEASHLLKAISELKKENPNFEMYVMLGTWIDCKNAWKSPIHTEESEQNAGEIERAVVLANQYKDIVKIISVGNEAMVRWATSYFVEPRIILKWVNHLQELKKVNKLPKDLWITSSDDFSSWGGDDASYHTPDLKKLVAAVDYISLHTYPFHNTHYRPAFWHVPANEEKLSKLEKIDAAMIRAQKFAKFQYDSVASYVKSLGITKPLHIGETGWAAISDGFYGDEGSMAADEYKNALYYNLMRKWTKDAGISCFYFEAFDERWKDAKNKNGCENHFGLFTIDGQAKYALWDWVDKGTFKGLTRNGKPITKTFGGDKNALLDKAMVPPIAKNNTK